MLDLCKFLGVEEGEEFTCGKHKYRIVKNIMQLYKDYEWSKTCVSINLVVERGIERLPFKPKEGEFFWVVDYLNETGVECWRNNIKDINRITKRVPVYRTKEEALRHVPKEWFDEEE